MPGPYALAGKGIQAIGSPAALVVTVTNFGNRSSEGSANPANFRNVGMVRPGDADGWYDPIGIHGSPQKIALPAGCTQLGYSMIAGSTVSVAEVPAPPALNSSLNPWDRAPIDVEVGGQSFLNGGQSDTVLITYTVPGGKLLWLADLVLTIKRRAAASANSVAYAYLNLGVNNLGGVEVVSNTIGASDYWSLAGAPLILPAGRVVSVHGGNLDTGGQVEVWASLVGFTFNP